MAKTVHFSVRLTTELKAKLDKLAAAENRTVGNLVETALREFVARRERPAERRK